MYKGLKKQRAKLLEKQGWICKLCERKIEPHNIVTVDHIIAVSIKRIDKVKNYAAVHYKCNQIKANLPMHILTKEMFYPENRRWIRVLMKGPKNRNGSVEEALKVLNLTSNPYDTYLSRANPTHDEAGVHQDQDAAGHP